jgi:hypothetical protein
MRIRTYLRLFNFTNFIIEQFNLKVDSSIWLSDQLQLHENKISVKIILYALNDVIMILII